MKQKRESTLLLFFVLIIFLGGILAGVLVVQQPQDIRKRADTTPTPQVTTPPLTLDPFTNDKKETSPTFTITGTSSPYTQITLEIPQDNVFVNLTTDENGAWRFIITKSLTKGPKELKVTATGADGGMTTYSESFTVVSKGFPSWIWLILGLILAIAAFIIIRRRTNEPPPTILESQETTLPST